MAFVEDPKFEKLIIFSIFFNSFLIGIENIDGCYFYLNDVFYLLENLFTGFFCIELFLKLKYYKFDFFKDSWRSFDFFVILLSIASVSSQLSILRSLRILRVLRMISAIPNLRKVINALLKSLPGLGSVFSILILIYYVGAILAKNFFGELFPEWFGTLSKSFYTLFQIMTLESWSMGIVRPIMEKITYAWLFFIPFILLTTFTMLNFLLRLLLMLWKQIVKIEINLEKKKNEEMI